ncbi:hypothetical protein [Microlunatus elymi]|nr:hypothetical protein [Microlunatus elymi]
MNLTERGKFSDLSRDLPEVDDVRHQDRLVVTEVGRAGLCNVPG